ncbi:DHHC palmitoyltransferase-domain-containing protein [Clohesyomyces aquaticus]|uniref:Palmitoyltransferase PFA4 n=1 Tax=Clohesyomyces aquaticus TaxID=1231657 RepID=A0A1Y2AA16_9PLEO|nr:DHHC palmitoyltransferase-domain-containing protein [Clohesyomyces aquaticus]
MELSALAVPSVYGLISFLAYSSQWLLLYLDPEPISKKQLIRFNVLLVCLLITYTRAVIVDPGRIPRSPEKEEDNIDGKDSGKGRKRWCRKCKATKPPRSHHCKECKRCIPKMDHHCPWTSNCVSHTTFPHFFRFLFYATTSMIYLFSLLWPRIKFVWDDRNLPSYLGPSIFQLAHLFMLTLANFFALFAVGILFVRNVWCLAVNTTTIEGWEIERHKTLVRRARYFGGYLDGPDGIQVRIQKQEFPYDIGFWKNFKQGMGTGNILSWFSPFSTTPSIQSSLTFETNDFEDPSVTWPPPDPDRMNRRVPHGIDRESEAFTYRDAELTPEDTIAAFRQRQEDDIVRRRKPFVQRLEAKVVRGEGSLGDEDEDEGVDRLDELGEVEVGEGAEGTGGGDGQREGEESWRNSEGERLRDFGVDEDIEFYDEEDDVPLSELLARKKARARARA